MYDMKPYFGKWHSSKKPPFLGHGCAMQNTEPSEWGIDHPPTDFGKNKAKPSPSKGLE